MPETARLLYIGGDEDEASCLESAVRRRGLRPLLRYVAHQDALASSLPQDDWDVVLCDLGASRIALERAIDAVLEHDPLIPVIVMCEPVSNDLVVALMRAGATDVLAGSDMPSVSAIVAREIAAGRKRRDAVSGRESKLRSTLNDSEQRYKLIVDNANDGICIFGADRTITFANRKLGDMLGHQPESLTGTDFFQLLHDDSQEFARERSASRLAGQQVAEIFECSFAHADGRKIDAFVTSTPFSTDQGWSSSLLLIADVTEIRKAEAALRQSQRMGALSVLAGGMAHDINNMLMPIIGLTEIAMKDLPEGGRAEQCLGKVIDAAERVTETVKGLLAFSRAEAGDRKPRAFKDVVANSVALLRLLLPSTIVIEEDVERADGQVLTDPVEINQVLMNLATNAKNAMGEKGILHISLERVDRPGGDRMPAGAHRPFMRLKVRDTGKGIAEDRIESIFDPFSTSASVGQGTGLGLSVVHGIVTDHGGSIELQSRPGEGAEFTLYFPVFAGGSTMRAAEATQIDTAHNELLHGAPPRSSTG